MRSLASIAMLAVLLDAGLAFARSAPATAPRAATVQQESIAQTPASTARVERVVAVRVHGNHTTPDADVLAIAQVALGTPVTADLLATVQRRLEASGRFRGVEIRKRYTSIADSSAVLLVIVVEERAGIAIDVPRPGPLRRLRASTMWLPVLRRDDGYGFTYGARFALVDFPGRGIRLAAPLTWGGERRAAIEIDRRFAHGPLSRVLGTVGISRREHPRLDVSDRRIEATLRAERDLAPWLLVGVAAGLGEVTFDGTPERTGRFTGHLAVDTRTDPAFPRDAIYAAVEVERLWFTTTPDTVRLTADARGYLGLFGQAVLAVRAFHVRSADPLPVFEQALLGGAATLRGFSLGYRSGDRLLTGSAEVRLPISSPLRIGRVGVALFADTGTAYAAREPLENARFDTALGAGVFFQIPLIAFRVDVARGLGASTRAHVTLGVTF